jgi:uncharacterized protein (TIGR02145 family)
MLICDCKKDEIITITDIDGNVYNTVTIGTQVWTNENLKTLSLNDGTTLSLFSYDTAWYNLITPGNCLYNNEPRNKKTTAFCAIGILLIQADFVPSGGMFLPTKNEQL